MVATKTLNVNDPVVAKKHVKNYVFAQFCLREPFFAYLVGMETSERLRTGEKANYITVDEFEVLQRHIQTGDVADATSIDPATSHTTPIGTTESTLARAVYGDLTCTYASEPESLYTYIHGGSRKKKLIESSLASKMTLGLTDQIYGSGAGNDADGIYKWLSPTANKWGVDCSIAGNYFFRGQVESEPVGNFSLQMLQDWHRKVYDGELLDDNGDKHYANIAGDIFGICDTTTFQTIAKMLMDKTVINQPVSPQQEIAKLGGFYKQGITIDSVTYFPSIGLNRKRDAAGTQGEILIIDPTSWEFIAYQGFALNVIDAYPDRDMSKSPFNLTPQLFSNVVWGRYFAMIALWNIFCGRPRNNLAASLV